MSSFITNILVKKITNLTLEILYKNKKKKLLFKEIGIAGNGWHIIGVNDFGHVFMPQEISISWDLVSGRELIKILNQIKNEEFTLK